MTKKQQRAAKLKQMRAFTDAHPEMSNDHVTEYTAMEEDFNALDAAIRREENLAAQEEALSNPTTEPIVASAGDDKDAKFNLMGFLAYVRGEDMDEYKGALSVSPDTKGGYLVPETYANKILSALPDASVLRNYATVIKTDGTFNIPIGGAKPVFGWIDEKGTYPTADTDFDNKSLEAWKVGGIIQVAEELLADAKFDLEGHLQGLIVEGLAEKEGTDFLTGDGVKKPLGISQSVPAENTKTVAVINTIAESDVEDLFLSVKAKYRKKGTWIISDSFFKAIFKMKNANSEAIWTKGMTEDEPGRIYGRPYEIDDNLTGTAGTPLAFFGDMKYYQIGDRGQMMMQRLNERFADDGMVGFKVYKRTDGKLTIDETVAMLKNAAV